MPNNRTCAIRLTVLLACTLTMASCDAITAQTIPDNGSVSRTNGGPALGGGQGGSRQNLNDNPTRQNNRTGQTEPNGNR